MKQLQEYFVNEYLTCGQARYNCIFENCPVDFLEKAEELLRQSSGNVKACIIKLSNQDEKQIEKTLSLCKNDYERGLLARDFVSSLVMKEILKDVESGEDKIKILQNIISCILQGEYEKAKSNHSASPMPADIGMTLRRLCKAELCFFLEDTQNVFIQRAINNFVATRETNYKVKIFTTNNKLSTYLDQGGTKIENPHDYISPNVLDNLSWNENENI